MRTIDANKDIPTAWEIRYPEGSRTRLWADSFEIEDGWGVFREKVKMTSDKFDGPRTATLAFFFVAVGSGVTVRRIFEDEQKEE